MIKMPGLSPARRRCVSACVRCPKLEEANQKELEQMKEKKDDLDVLFQPKRKW